MQCFGHENPQTIYRETTEVRIKSKSVTLISAKLLQNMDNISLIRIYAVSLKSNHWIVKQVHATSNALHMQSVVICKVE